MNEPSLKKVSVRISYEADDGYRSVVSYESRKDGASPNFALIEALEELSRLTALFGVEYQAKEVFEAARARVAKWKSDNGIA